MITDVSISELFGLKYCNFQGQICDPGLNYGERDKYPISWRERSTEVSVHISTLLNDYHLYKQCKLQNFTLILQIYNSM